MYLGCDARVSRVPDVSNCFDIELANNPLLDRVELPPILKRPVDLSGGELDSEQASQRFWYANLVAGVIEVGEGELCVAIGAWSACLQRK